MLYCSDTGVYSDTVLINLSHWWPWWVQNRPIMKQHMQWVVDHAEEIDKIAKVKAQISEVQVIISNNVDKVNKVKKL